MLVCVCVCVCVCAFCMFLNWQNPTRDLIETLQSNNYPVGCIVISDQC